MTRYRTVKFWANFFVEISKICIYIVVRHIWECEWWLLYQSHSQDIDATASVNTTYHSHTKTFHTVLTVGRVRAPSIDAHIRTGDLPVHTHTYPDIFLPAHTLLYQYKSQTHYLPSDPIASCYAGLYYFSGDWSSKGSLSLLVSTENNTPRYRKSHDYPRQVATER